MGRPRGGVDRGRERDDWPSKEHSSRPAPPTKIDAERFSRVARSAGVSWYRKEVLQIVSPSCEESVHTKVVSAVLPTVVAIADALRIMMAQL